MFFKKSNKKEAFNSRVTPSGINVRCAIMHAVHVYHYGHLHAEPSDLRDLILFPEEDYSARHCAGPLIVRNDSRNLG
jgi:hypothetical protein